MGSRDNSGVVAYTQNGGNTWNIVNPFGANHYLHLSIIGDKEFSQPGQVVISSGESPPYLSYQNSGKLFYTSNWGQTWDSKDTKYKVEWINSSGFLSAFVASNIFIGDYGEVLENNYFYSNNWGTPYLSYISLNYHLKGISESRGVWTSLYAVGTNASILEITGEYIPEYDVVIEDFNIQWLGNGAYKFTVTTYNSANQPRYVKIWYGPIISKAGPHPQDIDISLWRYYDFNAPPGNHTETWTDYFPYQNTQYCGYLWYFYVKSGGYAAPFNVIYDAGYQGFQNVPPVPDNPHTFFANSYTPNFSSLIFSNHGRIMSGQISDTGKLYKTYDHQISYPGNVIHFSRVYPLIFEYDEPPLYGYAEKPFKTLGSFTDMQWATGNKWIWYVNIPQYQVFPGEPITFFFPGGGQISTEMGTFMWGDYAYYSVGYCHYPQVYPKDMDAPSAIEEVRVFLVQPSGNFTRYWVAWKPLAENNEPHMAGYQICPVEYGVTGRTILNSALIPRNYYVFELPPGGPIKGAVRAVDRSGNIGPWSGPFYNTQTEEGDFFAYRLGKNTPALLGSGYDFGENNSPHFLVTPDNKIHVMWSENGKVYYRYSEEIKSPNPPWWSEPILLGAGKNPTIRMGDDGKIYVLWVKDGYPGGGEVYLAVIGKNAEEKYQIILPPQIVVMVYPGQYFALGAPSFYIYKDRGYATFTRYKGTMLSPLFFQISEIQLVYIDFPLNNPQDITFEVIKSVPFCIFPQPIPITPLPIPLPRPETTVVETSVVLTDTLSEALKSPCIVVDNYEQKHIVWDYIDCGLPEAPRVLDYFTRDGNMWVGSRLDINAITPNLAYEYNKLHLVYVKIDTTGQKTIVYRTFPIPVEGAQIQSKWSEITSLTPPGEVANPYYNKGKIVYQKIEYEPDWLVKGEECYVSKIYEKTKFDFSFENERKVHERTPVSSVYPQVSRTDNVIYYFWSEDFLTHGGVVWKAETVPVPPPLISENLGGTEPSPYTVKRDTFFEFGTGPEKTVDASYDTLIYRFENLTPSSVLRIEFCVYNGLNEKIKLRFDVDGDAKVNKWIDPGETLVFERPVTPDALQDSALIFKVIRERGPYSLLSWVKIKENPGTGAGGPQGIGAEISYKFDIYAKSVLARNGTVIYYSLPDKQKININVYDATGRKIETLLSGYAEEGIHSLEWKPKMGKGVYFVELKGEKMRKMGKIVFLR